MQSLEASGGNISGVSSGIPLSLQIETALKVIPFKSLGLFFNPREKNSEIQREELYELAKSLHFAVIDFRSPPVQNMLQENLQKLIDQSLVVDVVYLPLDSFLVSNAELIGPQLRVAKIKSIGSIKDYIEHGVLMGLVPDYYALGKVAATIVDRHRKGEPLSHIPVQRVKEPLLMINITTAKLLNVTIPENLLKKAILVE